MVFSPKVVNCHRPAFVAFLTFTEYFYVLKQHFQLRQQVQLSIFDFVCLQVYRSHNITEIQFMASFQVLLYNIEQAYIGYRISLARVKLIIRCLKTFTVQMPTTINISYFLNTNLHNNCAAHVCPPRTDQQVVGQQNNSTLGSLFTVLIFRSLPSNMICSFS